MRHGLTDGEREVMAEIERDAWEAVTPQPCSSCGAMVHGIGEETDLCGDCAGDVPDLWPPLTAAQKASIQRAQEQGRRAA